MRFQKLTVWRQSSRHWSHGHPRRLLRLRSLRTRHGIDTTMYHATTIPVSSWSTFRQHTHRKFHSSTHFSFLIFYILEAQAILIRHLNSSNFSSSFHRARVFRPSPAKCDLHHQRQRAVHRRVGGDHRWWLRHIWPPYARSAKYETMKVVFYRQKSNNLVDSIGCWDKRLELPLLVTC